MRTLHGDVKRVYKRGELIAYNRDFGKTVFNAYLTSTTDSTSGLGTFTRASLGTNGSPLTTKAINVPMFSPDGLGYLSEPAVTNKCSCNSVPRADFLGSELFVSPTLSTGWTDLGGGRYQANGSMGVGTGISVNTGNAGKQYLITFDIESYTSGALNPRAGNNIGTAKTSTGVTSSYRLVDTGGTLGIQVSVAFTGIVRNISIKEATDAVGTISKYEDGAIRQNIPFMTVSGHNNAKLSIVDGSADIDGLGSITNQNKVYRLDATACTTSLLVAFSAVTLGNINTHISSMWVKSTAGTGIIGVAANAGLQTTIGTNTTWTRVKTNAGIPDLSSRYFVITASPDQIIDFIIPECNEYTHITSEILSTGTQYTRAKTNDIYTYTNIVPNNGYVTNFTSFSQDFSNAAWNKIATCTVTGTTVINTPAVLDGVFNTVLNGSRPSGSKFLATAKLSGTGTLSFGFFDGTASQYQQITLTSTPTVYTKTFTTANTGTCIFYIRRIAGDTATVTTCAFAQVEDITSTPTKEYTGYISTQGVFGTGLVATHGFTIKLEWTYLGGATPTGSIYHGLFNLQGATNNGLYLLCTGPNLYFAKPVGGVENAITSLVNPVIGQTYNITCRLNNDFTTDLFVDKVKGITNSNSYPPAFGQNLNIGSYSSTTYISNSYIRNFKVIDTPLPDKEC